MKQVTIKQNYDTGGNPVRLTIGFGNAQRATSRLLIDGELHKIGDFVDFELSNMAGRKLSVKTTVSDISNETDRVDVKYLLKGGPAALEFALEAVAEANAKSVDFNADILFT